MYVDDALFLFTSLIPFSAADDSDVFGPVVMIHPSDEVTGDGAEDVFNQEDSDEGVPTLPLVTLQCRKRACKKFGEPFKYSSALFSHER